MNVVIAIDSFKGSMTSLEAGHAAERGVLAACSDAHVTVLPVADGGEGTVDALVAGLGGSFRTVDVAGPLGEPVKARYGILHNGTTAVMEMAQASGLALIPNEARDPWRTSTIGTGQMILDAIAAGCREFIIGIGGSATTEGGIGMLSALGWDFFDDKGELLSPTFASLGKIARIDDTRVSRELRECRFEIACDVTNPLCGSTGAVAVFGPQKGVKADEVAPMDAAMAHYAAIAEAFSDKSCVNAPGAGAAGGLGFAFLNFFPQVALRRGTEIVFDAIGLDEALEAADIAITGEGKLDAQTVMGKAPIGVARRAQAHGCRVIAFAGCIGEGAETCTNAGIDAYYSIADSNATLEQNMDPANAQRNMERTAEQVFRLLASNA